jgi:hypothetical protein
VADVRVRLNELLHQIPLLATNIRHSDVQHESIVAAVLARSPEQGSYRDGRAPGRQRGAAARLSRLTGS